MRKSFRFALLAVASVIALGLAGTALALYKPFLTIYEYSYKPAATPSVEIDYDQAKTEPAPARVTIIVPAGYGMDLTQAQNTNIGFVIAGVKTADNSIFAGSVITLTGPITVANPADYAAEPLHPGELRRRAIRRVPAERLDDVPGRLPRVHEPDYAHVLHLDVGRDPMEHRRRPSERRGDG